MSLWSDLWGNLLVSGVFIVWALWQNWKMKGGHRAGMERMRRIK